MRVFSFQLLALSTLNKNSGAYTVCQQQRAKQTDTSIGSKLKLVQTLGTNGKDFASDEQTKTDIRDRQKKCRKCGLYVNAEVRSRQAHCSDHVENECGIRNFFKCLLCPEARRYPYTISRLLNDHLKIKHGVKENFSQHYLDNNKEYIPLLKQMMVDCFGTYMYLLHLKWVKSA